MKPILRTALAVFAGFVAWIVVWVTSEKVISGLSPDWFGVHQAAFTAAIKSGAQGGVTFTPDSTILVFHVICAIIIAGIAGYLAALIARENKRAPLILGLVLLALGLLKAVMSWTLVPVWYHVAFTAVLVPMAIIGGRFRSRPAAISAG